MQITLIIDIFGGVFFFYSKKLLLLNINFNFNMGGPRNLCVEDLCWNWRKLDYNDFLKSLFKYYRYIEI